MEGVPVLQVLKPKRRNIQTTHEQSTEIDNRSFREGSGQSTLPHLLQPQPQHHPCRHRSEPANLSKLNQRNRSSLLPLMPKMIEFTIGRLEDPNQLRHKVEAQRVTDPCLLILVRCENLSPVTTHRSHHCLNASHKTNAQQQAVLRTCPHILPLLPLLQASDFAAQDILPVLPLLQASDCSSGHPTNPTAPTNFGLRSSQLP